MELASQTNFCSLSLILLVPPPLSLLFPLVISPILNQSFDGLTLSLSLSRSFPIPIPIPPLDEVECGEERSELFIVLSSGRFGLSLSCRERTW